MRRAALFFAVLLLGPLLAVARFDFDLSGDWRTADRSSAGIAPEPRSAPEAIVQVYAARAFEWRGLFAVHSWIATKPEGARTFTVHQVTGWNVRRGLSAVTSTAGAPDRSWFGSPPELLNDVRGETAEAMLPRIEAAVADYPYRDTYRVWPGPNSNTFVAWVGRRVPELGMNLPATAVGKDYLPEAWVARAPSGAGVQVSLFGLIGVLVAPVEGLEINLLGLTFGVDPTVPALKLPAIGRLGLSRSPQVEGAPRAGASSKAAG